MRKLSNRALSRQRSYACEQLEGRTLLSAAYLLKDINTNTLGNIVTPLARNGTTTFFEANDGVHGQELYTTNGTAAGTSMVTDLYPGSGNGVVLGYSGAFGAVLNNSVYFASNQFGLTLYKSDGTAGGTQYVKQLWNFYSGYADNFNVAAGKLFFNVLTNSAVEWVSDGTTTGTVPLGQAVPALNSLSVNSAVVTNNKLFLTARDSSNSTNLYVTDGTVAGTALLKSNVGSGLYVAGSRVLFEAASTTTDIWSTDGTLSGTALMSANKSIAQYASSPTKSYFIGYDGASASEALFSTNGTAAGTTVVKTGLGFVRTGMGLLPNGNALFVQEVGTTFELFRSDGSSAGTIMLQPIDAPNDQTFVVTDVGTVGVFSARDTAHGTTLWKSDGSVAGTTPLPINNYTQAYPSHFLGGGSPVYFGANDGIHGNELWKTDGTAAGTALVADIDQQSASSDASGFTLVNGKVWFSATSSAGEQPWVTDGTTAGTSVINTNPATQNYPGGYVGLGSKVFFSASAPLTGVRSLYVYNGSTVTLVQDTTAQPAGIVNYAAFNGLVYIASSGAHLWKTDGTPTGTIQISSTQSLASNPEFVVIGSTMYFTGLNGTNEEVYAINASNQITQLTTFTGLSGLLNHTSVLNGKLYFAIDNGGGLQLWQSNGSPAGTSQVKQVTTNEIGSGAIEIAASNNILYLAAVDPANVNNEELFKSDGTAAGTTFITDLTGVSQNTYEDGFVGVNGKLFFTATSAPHGSVIQTVWYSDGTATGTVNLMPNPANNPRVQSLTSAGNCVYFVATDLTYGKELFRSFGPTGWTGVVLDINSGPGDGFEYFTSNDYLAQIGGTLYLNANDGVHGSEPMVVYDQDTIFGTASGDSVILAQDADHSNIDWTTGTLSGKVPLNDPEGLIIQGMPGADVITLNYANGNPLPHVLHLNGTFTVNGLTGSNPLANTNLDIQKSTVYITYAGAASDPIAAIRGYLKNGYNNGTWNGAATATTGVIRSIFAPSPTFSTGIGYADSAEGLVSLPANTLELKYTLYGDTGLTGTVGFPDFMRMTQHYTQTTGATWSRGDFNYDGSVDAADFSLLQPNYGTTLAAATPAMTPITASPVSATPRVPSSPVATLPQDPTQDASTSTRHHLKRAPRKLAI